MCRLGIAASAWPSGSQVRAMLMPELLSLVSSLGGTLLWSCSTSLRALWGRRIVRVRYRTLQNGFELSELSETWSISSSISSVSMSVTSRPS